MWDFTIHRFDNDDKRKSLSNWEMADRWGKYPFDLTKDVSGNNHNLGYSRYDCKYDINGISTTLVQIVKVTFLFFFCLARTCLYIYISVE